MRSGRAGRKSRENSPFSVCARGVREDSHVYDNTVRVK